jgi:hypothetical protein
MNTKSTRDKVLKLYNRLCVQQPPLLATDKVQKSAGAEFRTPTTAVFILKSNVRA